jgi:hypothetical protein
MEQLWQALLHATDDGDEPLTCDDCLMLTDFFSDLLAEGYPKAEVLPLAERYLSRCSTSCWQELETLAGSIWNPGHERTPAMQGAGPVPALNVDG